MICQTFATLRMLRKLIAQDLAYRSSIEMEMGK
ncbi:hypothetical protein RLEG3_23240 [Rhizobium leguminosarum bv. trifolii WSM1689]|nr:hypothetical protein RLEG3_23240 [Rhizobium leguminosarum bv. trifolii WSM1689]